jgi:hypothetical protein
VAIRPVAVQAVNGEGLAGIQRPRTEPINIDELIQVVPQGVKGVDCHLGRRSWVAQDVLCTSEHLIEPPLEQLNKGEVLASAHSVHELSV